jgi:hypothetical protein
MHHFFHFTTADLIGHQSEDVLNSLHRIYDAIGDESSLPNGSQSRSYARRRQRLTFRKSGIENQFTHLPSTEVRIGSSSIMNCVFPMAPIMCVPVARYHFLDMLSPVWQPQLLT